MKGDEELETLLDEIPHAVLLNLGNNNHRRGHGGGDHHNHHHHGRSSMTQNPNAIMYGDDTTSHNNSNNLTCVSSVSGFSLHSDGSSSSLFSGRHSLSDNGSPPTPPAEESLPYSLSCPGTDPNFRRLGFNTPHYYSAENMADEINLARNLDRLRISDGTKNAHLSLQDYRVGLNVEQDRLRDNCNGAVHGLFGLQHQYGFHNLLGSLGAQLGLNGDQLFDHSSNGTGRLDVERRRLRDNYNGAAHGLVGSQYQCDLLGSTYSCSLGQADERFPQFNTADFALNSHSALKKSQAGHCYPMAVSSSNMLGTQSRLSVADDILEAQRYGSNVSAENGAFGMANMTPLHNVISPSNIFDYRQPVATAHNRFPPHVTMPHRSGGVFSGEDGLIIPEDGLNYVVRNGYGYSRKNLNRGSSYQAGVSPFEERSSLFDSCAQISRIQESTQSPRPCFSSQPLMYHPLAEAQGYIYYIAKDQNGCRFLQRMIDEGAQNVNIIFNEIIDHIIELMVNPFGNYLIQKLLEVRNEEQRMEVIRRVTAIPGELIKISLNPYGTRVVQQLIQKLKSRQETSQVISALQTGFLDLAEDPNGNHVIQECLKSFSNEDCQFIFVASIKHFIGMATHQHGCCVLQKCIEHSAGEHRQNFIAEISANGLWLAQHAFGNYVVQLTLDLMTPSATTKFLSNFEGNYVHLSTQKCSSHVVEKCLQVCNKDDQSKIIHELLSATPFEQLIQHPHANYVIQTALKVSEGLLYHLLVGAIEPHRATLVDNPYSKNIYSSNLLNK